MKIMYGNMTEEELDKILYANFVAAREEAIKKQKKGISKKKTKKE